MKCPLLVLSIGAALFAAVAPADDPVPATEADAPVPPAREPECFSPSDTAAIAARLGKSIRLRGRVARAGKSRSGVNFLNFEGTEFTVVSLPADLVYFKDGEPADLFEGRTIEITGTVSRYRGSWQVKLFSPDQVRVVPDPPAGKTGKPAAPAASVDGGSTPEDGADGAGDEGSIAPGEFFSEDR